jgi:hypothetical protein
MTKTKRIVNSIVVEELAKKILAKRPKVEENLKNVVGRMIHFYTLFSLEFKLKGWDPAEVAAAADPNRF